VPAPALVTPGGLRIDGRALTERHSRSGGPGGQHVNTSATRVELVCDLERADLPDDVRERLVDRFGPMVRVVAAAERSQARNRALARARLAARLDSANRRRAPRTATRPSAAARAARLDAKRRRSDVKSTRRRPAPDD
jgi:ribosome-associated protein